MSEVENEAKPVIVNVVRFLDQELIITEDMDEETKNRIKTAKENLDAAYELSFNDYETIAYVDITEQVKRAEEVQNCCFELRVASDFSVMGKKAMLERKYELAIFYFTKALRYNAKNPAYWCDRAEAFHNKGVLPRALDDCRQALSLKPQCARAQNRMGLIHCCAGNYMEGLECLKIALSIDDSNIDYKSNHRVVTNIQIADLEAEVEAEAGAGAETESLSSSTGDWNFDQPTSWSIIFDSDLDEVNYDFCDDPNADDEDISKLIIYRDGKDIDATRPLIYL